MVFSINATPDLGILQETKGPPEDAISKGTQPGGIGSPFGGHVQSTKLPLNSVLEKWHLGRRLPLSFYSGNCKGDTVSNQSFLGIFKLPSKLAE